MGIVLDLRPYLDPNRTCFLASWAAKVFKREVMHQVPHAIEDQRPNG